MGVQLALGPRYVGLVLAMALAAGSGSASAATTVQFAGAPLGVSPALVTPRSPQNQALPFQLAAPASLLPAAGAYVTNDVPSFNIDIRADEIRLSFVGSEEVFYLTSSPAPLGGRVLKYDTGEVALMVSGWGGVTLYSDEMPSGVPAELLRANALPSPIAPINTRPAQIADVKTLADQLAADVARRGLFRIGFSADFEMLSRENETTRSLAAEAMRNAAYALGQMTNKSEREAAAKILRQVRVNPAAQAGAAIQNGALVVSYAPGGGPSARPSSLAISRLLSQEF
jgi:hypothetical protein